MFLNDNTLSRVISVGPGAAGVALPKGQVQSAEYISAFKRAGEVQSAQSPS
eukprot:CAMPEP_0119508444 /NCGR_PEP_ID=MMETSP1344-20130328/28064_1 /TAXON_ID=236787 /ORGANISM="Florenciella parvula, Strain CCMP2471" /LENGTH=50 /DNA_ID=CAMNT_0007545189 /DNA_START=57 /DNA_END=209 /DNA_ORIENTATION=+